MAMAALSGEKTLAELAAEFGVHPTMISNWKQELVKRAGELFARGNRAPRAGAGRQWLPHERSGIIRFGRKLAPLRLVHRQ